MNERSYKWPSDTVFILGNESSTQKQGERDRTRKFVKMNSKALAKIWQTFQTFSRPKLAARA